MQKLTPVWTEDAFSEESEDPWEQRVFPDIQSRRMARVSLNSYFSLTASRLAWVVGVAVPRLSEHAAAAKVANHQ